MNPQLTLEKDEAELDEEEWRRAKEYRRAIGSRIHGIHPYQGSENKVFEKWFLRRRLFRGLFKRACSALASW